MTSEVLTNQIFRMPENAFDQLNNLPSVETREQICKSLATGMHSLLFLNGISIGGVSYRTKTVDRIQDKIKIRKSEGVLRDIYGVRFITEEAGRSRIKDIIQSAYPMTPSMFTDGRPSVREYADPKVRDFIRENFNPNISSLHSAMHINVVFSREGSRILEIAEVQIMNSAELATYNLTREDYVSSRKSNGSQPF